MRVLLLNQLCLGRTRGFLGLLTDLLRDLGLGLFFHALQLRSILGVLDCFLSLLEGEVAWLFEKLK